MLDLAFIRRIDAAAGANGSVTALFDGSWSDDEAAQLALVGSDDFPGRLAAATVAALVAGDDTSAIRVSLAQVAEALDGKEGDG
ncbi:hypothetical protein [Microbacterium sp. A84]|uniref:hypothetical protein n=1 Tax=Microbacterium sp. A84 TaxID=3450715 RepID=UPI003F43B7D3